MRTCTTEFTALSYLCFYFYLDISIASGGFVVGDMGRTTCGGATDSGGFAAARISQESIHEGSRPKLDHDARRSF